MSQPRIKKPEVLVVNPGDDPTAPGEHNYIRKLLSMQHAGLLPVTGLYQLQVHHDDWCGVFRGARCDCDPVIEAHPAISGDAQ